MWTDDQKEREIQEARVIITQIDAALVLIQNNDLACEIHVSGLVIGLSDNKTIMPVLKKERAEIEKYLRGEPNKWE